MKKVLIATDKPFAPVAVKAMRKVVEAANYELVLLERYKDKEQLLAAVKDVDALIMRSDIIDTEVLDAANKLKIAVRAGAGYDNIDLDSATSHQVCVMNTPGQNSNAVAELAIGMLIYAMRNFYRGTSGLELKGKKIGLLAYGNVGRNVARIAKGLQMDVYAYDAFCSCDCMEKEGVKPTSNIEELFETCQVVSIHIPLTPETKGSIGRKLFNNMPKNAVVINTARKEVINEAELLEVLKERADFKYVTDIQPDMHDELIEACPDQYYSTPKKMGAQTAEANINAGIAAAEEVVEYLKSGNEQFRVNK